MITIPKIQCPKLNFSKWAAKIRPILQKIKPIVTNVKIMLPAAGALIVALVVVLLCTANVRKYNRAERYIEKGNHQKAYELFYELGDYKDSKLRLTQFVAKYDTYTSTALPSGKTTKTQHTYDESGRLLRTEYTSTAGVSTDEYTYNEKGLETSVLHSGNGATTLTETVYTYNEKGAVSTATVTSGGASVTTTYFYTDDGDIVEEIVKNEISTTYYTYNKFGKREKERCVYKSGTSLITLYTYNEIGDPLTVDSEDFKEQYTYDSDWNLIKRVTSTASGTTTIEYMYENGVLTKSIKTDSKGVAVETVYTFDAQGNLLKAESRDKVEEYSGYRYFYVG